MSNINDGGAAFPVSWDVANSEILNCMGMSLRDYFAAKAMQGLLCGQYIETSRYNLSEVPEEAYKIADAMLKTRGES